MGFRSAGADARAVHPAGAATAPGLLVRSRRRRPRRGLRGDARLALLRLRAEMKVPGRAWLEMTVRPRDGGSTYHQRAVFIPHGLPGFLYWWSVAPFHGIVFGGMVRNITRTAERADDGAPDTPPASRRPSWLRSRRSAGRAA